MKDSYLLRFKSLNGNLVDDGGASGLNHACLKGHIEIGKLLLSDSEISQEHVLHRVWAAKMRNHQAKA